MQQTVGTPIFAPPEMFVFDKGEVFYTKSVDI